MVLASVEDAAGTSSCTALVSRGGVATAALSEDRVQQLRWDREAHRYREIWTKDAHGGPYRKVS